VLEDVLWVAVPLIACAAMIYAAVRIEPHWTSKDGTRFLTTAEVVDGRGEPTERRREVRGAIRDDGVVILARRSLFRTTTQEMRVAAKSASPPKRKAVYLLDTIPPSSDGAKMVLRLPASSRAVTRLDALINQPGTDATDRRAGPS
jgi:hypothetical protein